jgi:hypothetical protein
MRRRESTNDFVYVGPLNPSSEAKPQKALSPESARYVALSCWRIPGRLRPTGHFAKRLIQRRFDIFDFEEVIRLGKPLGKGIFCPKFNNYKYQFLGVVDGLGLRAVFAIDATQDYQVAPLVILITAAWNTESGKRKR